MPNSPLKILLVAQLMTMRRTIRHLLRQVGYDNVIEADDGSAALVELRQRNFRLIIADWHLTPMSGLDLLKAIRSEATLQKLPVLLMLSEVNKADIEAAKQAGVTQLLIKPFSAQVLGEKIQALFAPKAAQSSKKTGQVLQELLTRRYS